jgi:hypothetical protein
MATLGDRSQERPSVDVHAAATWYSEPGSPIGVAPPTATQPGPPAVTAVAAGTSTNADHVEPRLAGAFVGEPPVPAVTPGLGRASPGVSVAEGGLAEANEVGRTLGAAARQPATTTAVPAMSRMRRAGRCVVRSGTIHVPFRR